MQPWWLHRWWQRELYVLGSTIGAIVGGGLLGTISGLLLGLIFGLGLEAVIWGFPSELERPGWILRNTLSDPGDGLVYGLTIGPIFGGLAFGLVGGLVVGLFQRVLARRRTCMWLPVGCSLAG